MFDMEAAQHSAGWLKELQGKHTPETEEYGISSFVFKARRPFHPLRLMNFLSGDHMRTVLRSKGFFWLATRHNAGMNWSLAGHIVRVSPAGNWLAGTPPERWPAPDQVAEYVEHYWQEPFGDRRQELVFIGMNMPKEAMLQQLQAALLTDDELGMGERGWQVFPDSFPVWEVQAN